MADHDHTDFIAALGKAAELAEFLTVRSGEQVSEDAIYKWKERNRIPHKWLPWLRLRATQEGVPIPPSLRDPALEAAKTA